MKNTTHFDVGDVLKIDTRYQDPINLDFQIITTTNQNIDKFNFQIDGSVIFQFLGRFQILRERDFIIVQILDASKCDELNGSVGFIRENKEIMFRVLNKYELPILWYKGHSDSEFNTFRDFYTNKENFPDEITSRISHVLWHIGLCNQLEYYDSETDSYENQNKYSFQQAVDIVFGTPAEPKLDSPKRLTFELKCEIHSPEGKYDVYIVIDRNETHIQFGNSFFNCNKIYEPQFTWKEVYDKINKGLSEIEEIIYGDDPDDRYAKNSIQYFYSLVDLTDKYISNDVQCLYPQFKSDLKLLVD